MRKRCAVFVWAVLLWRFVAVLLLPALCNGRCVAVLLLTVVVLYNIYL
jgi:hypothetical protein